jgi:hypothetical protein
MLVVAVVDLHTAERLRDSLRQIRYCASARAG